MIYIFVLFCSIFLCSNPAQSGSLLSSFKESSRLNMYEKQKDNLEKLQRLNNQIKQELAQGRQITDVLNRISQGDIEKNVLVNFTAVMSLQKSYNDQLQKRLEQRAFKDENERRQMQRAYQVLSVDLTPGDIRKLPYIYPMIMPIANYAMPGSVKINDIDRAWLENEQNFKYCFFYLYRRQADLGRTHKSYSLLCGKMGISDKEGFAALTKFFNHDLDFGFFDQKFDNGIFNKESKFFGFEGYNFKYLKNESQTDVPQSALTKAFKNYCVYNEHCKGCDLVEFYNKRKMGMFNDLVLEIEQGAGYNADNLEAYLKPLYYLCRTFPNISAFVLTGKDGKYKFTDHAEKSPVWEKLKSVWKNGFAKEKEPTEAINMIKYTLGSICLLPQKEVLPASEDYTFDRSGYATYMQEYIAIYNKYQAAVK